MGGTAAAVGFITDRFSIAQSVAYFLSSICFVENIYNYYNPNNFGYLWFIACEFQFMILFSILLIVMTRTRMMIFLTVMLFCLTFYHPHIRTNLLFEFHGLILGVMLWKLVDERPYILQKIKKFSNMRKRLIFYVSIILGLAMCKFVRADLSFTLSSVSFGVSMLMVLSSNVAIYGRSFEIVKIIGDASYSIYLCHIPLIILLDYLLQGTILYDNTILYFAFVMCIIVISGLISKKYIETI